MTAVTPGARPADLVPGDPDEVDRLVVRLTRIAASAGDSARGLRGLDGDVWTGESARVFRAAIGDVPTRLDQAAAAFGSAARALVAYARSLREGQATAAAAVRMVESAAPETAAADQQAADRLLARATADVEAAGRLAAERLARAEADAPAPDAGGAAGTAPALRVVTEHELTAPDDLVATPGEWGGSVSEMRYTTPHEVAFAAGGAGGAGGAESGSWASWTAGADGRGTGMVEAGTVAAAAGVAVAAGTLIGRRRGSRTALDLVGLDEGELRRRRDEFGGPRHRGAASTIGRTARLSDIDAWRTRLVTSARLEGTVPHWAGPGADRLARVRVLAGSAGSVDRDVRGAVLRTGRPAHEAS